MTGLIFALLLSSLVGGGHRPVAHFTHGTVGVVYYTDDNIIFAADSHGIDRDEGQENHECKILALGGQVLFFSSGISQITFHDNLGPLSNTLEARNAYQQTLASYGTARGHVGDIAAQWGSNMKAQYNTMGPAAVKQVDQSNQLPHGVFGGLDADGKLVLFWTHLTSDPGGAQFTTAAIQCKIDNTCAFRSPDIPNEFLRKETPRAKEEAETWRPRKGSRPSDRDILKTMRLVELTIRYSPPGLVGGTIDAVQMNRDGSVHWFARKQNCPIR